MMLSQLLHQFQDNHDYSLIEDVDRLSDSNSNNNSDNDHASITEHETSNRVAAETRLTLQQIDAALTEVKVFNLSRSKRELETSLSGFALMESNLETLKQKMIELQQWHAEKHMKTSMSEEEEKKLFMAEVSILLLTPYIHRLLTTEERKNPEEILRGIASKSAASSPGSHRSATTLRMDLNFNDIDPIYSTRYDGVCLAGLMRSVYRDMRHGVFGLACCLGNTKKVSFWHKGHARVLASKFFGAITCLEMILTLGAQAEEDLILSKAVGQRPETEVEGIVEKCLLYDRRSAERNLRFFTGMILVANAVVASGYDKPYLLTRLATYAWSAFRFIMPWNMAEAELRGEVCYTGTKEEVNAKLHFARFVWNLPETPLVKGFYRLGLPRVRVDHEFYIPPQRPTEPRLEGGADPIFARVVSNRKQYKLPRTTSMKRAMAYTWGDVDLSPIQPSTSPLSPLSDSFLTPTQSNNKTSMKPFSDVLLVCFHGGGFIALTSFSHENYYRIWARDMPGVTIVASDYRLAPDHQFPYAFNDAYRTYRYAVENCESELGFRPRKILVAGDSAGGNLTAAITVRAIQDNFRVPDGLLLIYPVVDMRRVFSPSLMWSVNDRIVPFVFLECCMSAYLGSPEDAKHRALDTRCSPALADESVLRKFPPTRIVVGDCDPLMDQSIRFANHLATIGVDVQCKIFQAMPHGFCSFIWPIVGVPEVKKCVDSCTQILKDLASNQEIPLQF